MIPGLGRSPGRHGNPTRVFFSRESQGQRSLEGCSPKGCKESDRIEVTWHTSWAAAHRAPGPSPAPHICANSCPLSRWCHPTTSSPAAPFSYCVSSIRLLLMSFKYIIPVVNELVCGIYIALNRLNIDFKKINFPCLATAFINHLTEGGKKSLFKKRGHWRYHSEFQPDYRAFMPS